MELRARNRPLLRRAAWLAALAALIASALAGAASDAQAAKKKKKAKPPVITRVTPMDVAVGEKLTIRGRHFLRGRKKNTVVFKRDGARAVFVKADIGTTKLLTLKVPDKLQEFFGLRNGEPAPTRFRLRVLTKRFGKKFTADRLSPVVSAPRPPKPVPAPETLPDGDCDGDGQLNRVDVDDDNDALTDAVENSLSLNECDGDSDDDGVADRWEFDCDRNGVLNRDQADDDSDLLSDELETRLTLNPCSTDTDGDQVADGYEYQSAIDLNDDEYQEPQTVLPHPDKRPYPNPLNADAGRDYDGDVLTLKEEHDLWVAFGNTRSLDALLYSDGNQYSLYGRDGAGRRPGALVDPARDPFLKYQAFLGWAAGSGYGSIVYRGATLALRDVNRNGSLAGTAGSRDGGVYAHSETNYFDFDGDGKLSDNERDEDADGLSNYDETHGRMQPVYWEGCYDKEGMFPIPYAGTSHVDGDTDGDGVLDGADDQDHDDLPNLMELSRGMANGRAYVAGCDESVNSTGYDPLPLDPTHGWVQPFNPCLPYTDSRTCPRHPDLSEPYAPFASSTPRFQVID